MSRFSDWTIQKLQKRFGLIDNHEHQALAEWLGGMSEIDANDETKLLALSKSLTHRIDYYNEQELIINVIAPVLSFIQFQGRSFSSFSERYISAIIDGEELSGFPDLLIAHGTQDPENPFFCLHEYKKTLEADKDPHGQCLAAMLVAQKLNGQDMPIYGCSVLGKEWRFFVLIGLEFAISNVYIITQNDILDIVRILKALKSKIIAFEAKGLF